MTQAFLFDFNGVLVDDEHVHLEAFNAVLAPLDLQITDAAYAERYLGFDDRGAFEAVLRDAGRTFVAREIADLIEQKAAIYLQRACRGLRIFPGAVDAVRAAVERAPIAIVSGALRAEIELALDIMGVRSCVPVVVAAEDVQVCKPDPEGYVQAVGRLRSLGHPVEAGRAIAIEDSVAGIEAALAAGLRVWAVAHTYDRAQLEDAGAHEVHASIADIARRVAAGQ